MPERRTFGHPGRHAFGAQPLRQPNPYGASAFPAGYGNRPDEEEEGPGIAAGPFDCLVCGKNCTCRIGLAGHMRSHKK